MRVLFTTLIYFFTFFYPKAYANEQVNLYLKWMHQFQFAGYYVAKEKGYYDQEGIDVNIIERDKKWSVIDKVMKGTNNYGVSDSSVIKDYLNGKPVVLVSSIFQRSPLVLATRKEDKIFSPENLIGKKVMYQKDIDDAAFKIMFENVAINESDLIHVPHTLNLKSFIDKKVDAISIYTTNQTYTLKKLKIDYHLIHPRNYGVDLYGDMIITSKEEAQKHSKRVEGFKKASLKGWYYAINNIEEVAKLINEKYNSNIDIKKLIHEGNEIYNIIRPDLIPIGETRLSRIKNIGNYYNQYKNYEVTQYDNLVFEHIRDQNKNINKKRNKFFLIILSSSLFLLGSLLLFSKYLSKVIKKQKLELENIYQQRNSIFTTLTHDLRTPLNGIVATIQELSTTLHLTNDQKELFKIANHSSETMLQVVDEILDFSKLENNEFKLFPTDIHIGRLLENTYNSLKLQATNKDLELSFSIPHELNEYFYLDKNILTRILNNLIGNAIKYTNEGKIEVNCNIKPIKGLYILSFDIIDTGIGISPENLQSIFDPFKQLGDNSMGSTGLGLNIAKNFIKMLGGDIKANINKSGGMTFNFWITISPPSINFKEEENPPSYKIFDMSNTNVLIVDDNQINQKILSRYLLKYNMKVNFASNGAEAFKIIEESYFDIVFIDKNMPIIDGTELALKLRKHKNPRVKNLYIIGQSGSWVNGLDKECEKFGINSSLSKPLSQKDLNNALVLYSNSLNKKSA